MYHISLSRSRGNFRLVFYVSLFIILGGFLSPHKTLAANTNLIPNSDFESTDAPGMPVGWIHGRWGTNTTLFTYPAPGVNGSKGAEVAITQYTSGDAKWAFNSVPVTSGHTYQFSDYYKSNVSSFITLQYQMNDGSFTYKDIATPGPQADFQPVTVEFVVPQNVAAVTVFHLINQVGDLTVDNYSLTDTEAAPPPPPPPQDPSNLIPNPSLESADASGMPQNWSKGGWGTNARSLSYPVAGYLSSKAARVDITQYTSGDAKWYFNDVSVSPGTALQFSDFSRNSTKSYITVRFTLSDGTFQYLDLGSLDPSSAWQQFSIPFTAPLNTVSLTIFHLIKGVGFLETDNYSLAKLPNDPTKFNQGLISINFDDGWLSTYQNAFPILDQAGFKSDTFIITSRMASGTYPTYVKVNDVRAMQSAGHVIGAHTQTHPDLTAIPPNQAQAEITGSRNDLFAIGASPVNFFAYPFGAYNDSVKQMVKDAGFVAARSSDGGYNMKTQDRFALRRQPMINTTTIDQVKNYIDTAIADKTWVILLFHEVDTSGNTYSVTPALFQQIVDYLKSKNITPVTVSQGIQAMNQ